MSNLNNYNDANDIENVGNGINVYLRNNCKHPLLTEDEEVYYATLLDDNRDSILFDVTEQDGCRMYNLNLGLLFCSLCNNQDYEFIIEKLIECYNSLNINNITYNQLFQYAKETKVLNRSLNSNELKKLFNIDYNKVNKVLENQQLLNEVKKFINFKFAYNKLFVSNLRLVVNIAFKYKSLIKDSGLDVLDLISEGNISLTKAIDNYNVSLGYRFSTYATQAIKQGIRRSFATYKMIIRVPEYYNRNIFNFKNKVAELNEKEERVLSPDEIAKALSMPVKIVNEYLSYMQSPLYLDNPISEEGDITLKDVLSSSENIEDDVLRKTLKDKIEILYHPLTEREKMVIKMRFGLDEYKNDDSSINNIAKKLGVSYQRTAQIISRALYKMKLYARKVDEAKAIREYVR